MGVLHPASTILAGALLLAVAVPGPVRGGAVSPATTATIAAAAAEVTGLIPLTIRVRDAQGVAMAARVSVTGSDGLPRPGAVDASLMTHCATGGYFYVDAAATVYVPSGLTTIVASRGFEYTPVCTIVDVRRSVTVRVTLERMVDLSLQGWFAGDPHVHARHGPIDYDLTPSLVKRVALAEGLSILELLDDDWQFTGGPDPVSEPGTILYFSYEHRNQIGGHLGLPGLAAAVPSGCCLSPEPPYPMLVDLAAQAHAQAGARVVLSHPHTTDDYDLLSAWPGAGLARELPVLVALGGLDAIDVASYSNEPDFDTTDWYALLSAGASLPPSAGTDAALSWFNSAPPGGWRVYANVGGTMLDHDGWFDALAAGRSFVTSFPLVAGFAVGGSGPGETLEVAGDSLVATVSLDVACAVGLAGVTIVADGSDVWTRPIPASPTSCAFDTTFTLRLVRPGWLLLRVDGIAGHPAVPAPQTVAYTNAVRILRDGAPLRRQEALDYWLDRLDAYEELVLARCDWPLGWQRDTVLARVSRARQHFGGLFRARPADFSLESPQPGDTAWVGLSWTAAADPDSGDRVTYRVSVGTDSTLADAQVIRTQSTSLPDLGLVPCREYWWSVAAEDRGGDVTTSTPRLGWFYQPGVLDVAGASGPGQPRAWPNPSRGAVVLRGLGSRVEIYDLAGRRVASPGHGVRADAGGATWDGRDGGQPAAPGVYLARGAGADRPLRIVRLR